MPLQRLGSVCPPLRGARGHKANCWWGPGGCAGAALGCAIVLLLTSLAAALRCCCPVRLQVCWLVGTGGCSCCRCKPIRAPRSGGQVREFWCHGGGRTAVQAHVAKAGAVGSPWCCTGDKSIPVSIGLSRSESVAPIAVAPIACAVQRFPAMLVPRPHGRGRSKGADCNSGRMPCGGAGTPLVPLEVCVRLAGSVCVRLAGSGINTPCVAQRSWNRTSASGLQGRRHEGQVG